MTGIRVWVLLASLFACPAVTAQDAPPPAGLSSISFQGVERKYLLRKPPAAKGAIPLIIALHGLNQTVEGVRRSLAIDALAERESFAVLYPMALGGRWSYDESRPVKLPEQGGLVDDVGFLNAILDQLIAEGGIDPSRIYAAGLSNGGLMAWTMACRMSERLAGVAALISGMLEHQVEQCKPKRLVPLVVIAGTEDWLQPYDGAITENFRLLSIPETLEFWRRQRGCVAYETTAVDPRDPSDPTRAVVMDWKDCKNPSALRFYRIEGGGHSLPSLEPVSQDKRSTHGGRHSHAIETADELWKFFQAQRL
jgi:polyhydroxybutyrate depolymerase